MINYDDYKKMIYKIAWQFKKKNPSFDISDLISEANLIFVKCTRLYDENKNIKFSTYLYSSLRKQLLFFIKKENKSISDPLEIEIEKNINFTFFEMSDISKNIVHYVLNLPKKESQRKIAERIHKQTGIEYKNIRFYFDEIKECLI